MVVELTRDLPLAAKESLLYIYGTPIYTLDLDSRQDYLEGGEPIHTGTVGDRANERSK